MRCTVLLFAQARELAATDQVAIDLHAGSTVADALATLFDRYPALEPMRDRLAIAVDERYASPSAPLYDRCTIALIPPVSGG